MRVAMQRGDWLARSQDQPPLTTLGAIGGMHRLRDPGIVPEDILVLIQQRQRGDWRAPLEQAAEQWWGD